ncbi:MAG: septum formation initiator family protein [Prevotella sp.]|nr:septum formation initiator family protein [Prevotella sp.]MBR1462459.1 septum formation initiator family protein [Prevotella sp.]
MERTNPFYSFLSHNKYWIVLIIGGLIVGVLDENSFYQRIKYELQISELKEQISEFNSQYEKDEAQLKELRRNPKAITKIARERYFMKADDEDIFVLSDDLQPTTEENDERVK